MKIFEDIPTGGVIFLKSKFGDDSFINELKDVLYEKTD